MEAEPPAAPDTVPPTRYRDVRYQGAIVEGGRLLLIRYRDHLTESSFWLIPGGGREPGESEEECVQREMREETTLDIRVERLLFEAPCAPDDPTYLRTRTYLCRIESGTALPGYEPGPPIPEGYGIVEVAWFDLTRPDTWGDGIHGDAITGPLVRRIAGALGIV